MQYDMIPIRYVHTAGGYQFDGLGKVSRKAWIDCHDTVYFDPLPPWIQVLDTSVRSLSGADHFLEALSFS